MTHPVRWSFLVVLIALVISAFLTGCLDINYTPTRDIVVIKLDTNGAEQWVRTIDSGQDDSGEDMAELANGELVVVGQKGTSRWTFESPRVIRLSSDGKVIADRTDGGRSDRPSAVIADPEGGFAVLMQGGELTRYDLSGAAVWSCTTAMWEAPSLTKLRDGGYLVGGYTVYQDWATNNSSVTGEYTVPQPIVTTATSRSESRPPMNTTPADPAIEISSPTGAGSRPTTPRTIVIPSYTPSTMVKRAQAVRYSAEGALEWQRIYGEEIAAVWSAQEDRDGSLLLAGPSAYLSDGRSPVQELVVLRADRDGAASPAILLGYVESQGTVRMQNVPDGTRVVYSTWSSGGQHPGSSVASTLLAPTGQVIGNRSLMGSRVFNVTSDDGVISVGVPVARGDENYVSSLSPGPHTYTTFHALRFNAEGTLVWNHPLSIGSIREVTRVIQTADGGYAILAMTEKG